MKSALLSLCLMGLSLAAVAQEADTVLTFKEAVQVALRNNATLNSQRNNLIQSKVNRTFRIAQLGPQASVSASLYQSNGNRFIQQEGKVVNATVNGAQASLNVSQPIFGGFQSLNAAKQSSSLLDAQMEQVNRSTQDVINSVATQFLQVLLDQELLIIAKENLQVQKTQYEQVKAHVELGSRSPVDEFNQQAQVSNAELRVAQAEFTLVSDKILLFQTLMLDPTVVSTIEEPDWDVNAIALDNLDLNQLLEVAATHRSDLKQARATEKASRFFLRSNRGNYYPYLSAFYNNGSAFNQLSGADKNDPSYRTFNQQFFTDNRNNSFGLSLYVPLFTGLQTRMAVVQSKVLYENNKLRTENIEITVKGDVVRAYENFNNVKKAYTAGLNGLEASKRAFDLEQERFNLGVTSFVDFANANRTLIQAQTDMAQAKYRFLFQKIVLDYAIGTLKAEDIQ